MGTESTNVTTFKEGDRVLVTEGDLKNLDGVVSSVNDEGKLLVKPSLAELADSEPLPIEPQHVIKFFQVWRFASVLFRAVYPVLSQGACLVLGSVACVSYGGCLVLALVACLDQGAFLAQGSVGCPRCLSCPRLCSLSYPRCLVVSTVACLVQHTVACLAQHIALCLVLHALSQVLLCLTLHSPAALLWRSLTAVLWLAALRLWEHIWLEQPAQSFCETASGYQQV